MARGHAAMTFTGINLIHVRRALALAVEHTHHEIATCSDVEIWAEEIEELERDKASYEKLLARIDGRLLP
jgi:hypothetical protein